MPAGRPARVDDRPADARVVVLGGGLAGLTAAYKLMTAGCSVVLLEACEQVGGRVKTERDAFVNGGYAELGALRILDEHRFTLRYVQTFGLEDKLAELREGRTMWFLSGQCFLTPAPGEQWPLEDMSAEERADPFRALERYFKPAFDGIGDVTSRAWPAGSHAVAEFESVSVGEYLRANGASTSCVRVFAARNGGMLDFNAAAAAASEVSDVAATKAFALRGGNDQLPRAFAAALDGRVRTGATVARVCNESTSVTVGYRDEHGRRHELVADFCVCAIPFPVLKRLELEGFTDDKLNAVNEFDLAPAGKVFYQTKSRFWQRNRPAGPGGLHLVCTDTPAGRILDTSELHDTAEGMLHAYLFPPEARALQKVPAQERSDRIEGEMVHFLPELRGSVVATCSKLWQEDPLQLGACAAVRPGQLSWIVNAARRPDKRVHFAGEHTVAHVGWMDGAIESGERAAAELIDRLGENEIRLD
jgi:monoamine oxidase